MNWKKPLTVTLTSLLLLGAGCGKKSPASQLPPPTGVLGKGVISGKVTFKGAVPQAAKISMDADPACQAQHPNPVYDESLVVGPQGGLANVLVYVKEGAAVYAPPSTAVTLNQTACLYQPHVFGVQVNQPLEIFNQDPTLHNVHAVAVTNDGFNVGENQNDKTEQVFTQPEMPVKFKCDVHSWMNCYGGVFTHPFFRVTGKDGAYQITGLPAGDYTLVAWQEKYGFSAPQKVSLKDGGSASLNFSFGAP
ncbi:MAG TPA: carboxypeptidase-like regulatory domain-containing protein [bacterium]|nr:carboxypeptidase-like regulatory domain-containing protein [bacterium]